MNTILLVGYGWFASIPEGETNNAELIARALDGENICSESGRSAKVRSLVVPVVWEEAFPPVEAAIREHAPDIILALGTDASACAMRPEPWAINWMRGRDTAINGCVTDRDQPILPGNEEVRRGTLPYAEMTRAMLRAGIPAQTGILSDAPADYPASKKSTTGLYLCNYMAYRLALLSRTHPQIRAGFMHVPTQPAYACARRLNTAEDEEALCVPMLPSMPLKMMIQGTHEALRICLDAR